MKSLLLFIVVVLLNTQAVFAQESEDATTTPEVPEVAQSMQLGTETVNYSVTEEMRAGTLYYQEDGATGARTLVMSTHDTNEDEQNDIWILYASDGTVRLEAHDTDGNAEPDTYVTLTPQGTVSGVTGLQAESLTEPILSTFTPQGAALNDTDLVGDLSDVTIGGQSQAWIFFIILFIAGAIVYFFMRRQREEE